MMLYPGAGYPGLYFPLVGGAGAAGEREIFDFETRVCLEQSVNTTVMTVFDEAVGVRVALDFDVEVER